VTAWSVAAHKPARCCRLCFNSQPPDLLFLRTHWWYPGLDYTFYLSSHFCSHFYSEQGREDWLGCCPARRSQLDSFNLIARQEVSSILTCQRGPRRTRLPSWSCFLARLYVWWEGSHRRMDGLWCTLQARFLTAFGNVACSGEKILIPFLDSSLGDRSYNLRSCA